MCIHVWVCMWVHAHAHLNVGVGAHAHTLMHVGVGAYAYTCMHMCVWGWGEGYICMDSALSCRYVVLQKSPCALYHIHQSSLEYKSTQLIMFSVLLVGPRRSYRVQSAWARRVQLMTIYQKTCITIIAVLVDRALNFGWVTPYQLITLRNYCWNICLSSSTLWDCCCSVRLVTMGKKKLKPRNKLYLCWTICPLGFVFNSAPTCWITSTKVSLHSTGWGNEGKICYRKFLWHSVLLKELVHPYK